MTPEQTRRFKYWQTRTIIATMVGYALFYFVRKNFSFAIPGLEAEYGISKTSFGVIMTVIGLIYGFSRFVNGLLADRMNARWHMAIGLALCAVANFAFGFGTDISTWITGQNSGPQFVNTLVLVFGVLLVVNNLFQGSGFPPCARLLTHWISPHELATKMSVWNTSHSIGASLVAVLCGYIMGHLGMDMSGDPAVVDQVMQNLHVDPSDSSRMAGVMASAAHFEAWRWCFWIPGALALAGAVGLVVSLRDTPPSVGLPELADTKVSLKSENRGKSSEYKAFLREKVFGNRLIWILGFANFFVYVVRFSVLDWGPTFLKEARGLSLTNAGWTVAIFEIFGIVGMLVAGWATDRFFGGRAHRTCVFCMAGAALFMLIFWWLPASASIYVLVPVLAMAGFFIYGPQALIGIAAANQATKKAAATANGLTGMFGYASVFVSGLGIGMLVDWINGLRPGMGWDYVFLIMIGIALVGMLVFLMMWNARADGYEAQPAEE